MADDSYSNSKELGKSLGKTLGSFKFVLCRLGTKNTIDDLQTYLLAPYFSICLFMNLNFKLSNHRVFCKPISDLFRWPIHDLTRLLKIGFAMFFKDGGLANITKWEWVVFTNEGPQWLIIIIPTVVNEIHWLAGSMGQTNHQPSVWCSKHYFSS